MSENMSLEKLVVVKNLTKKFALESGFFSRKDRFVYAVNDVSFSIERGTTYGLVGESGSGKSTTAKLLVGMYKKDGGTIEFNSCTSAKYIFQDPARSLNPRMSVYSILTDSLKYSKKYPGKQKALEMAQKIIEEVGLDKKDLERRPSEFSGGQRQRISIARALLSDPEFLICDEVVSALDVSIQGQILNLLQDLRKKRNLTYLFIAHDLRVSCYFCDVIGVMYGGVLVEEAPAAQIYKTALHPYTKFLFEGAQGKAELNCGEVKTALSTLKGCPFAHRCPNALERCRNEIPDWKSVEDGHKVRCFALN